MAMKWNMAHALSRRRAMGEYRFKNWELRRGCAGNAVRANGWKLDAISFRGHDTQHQGGWTIRQVGDRLRHRRMAGVAGLASLIAGFAVPMQGHVQAEPADSRDQKNSDYCI